MWIYLAFALVALFALVPLLLAIFEPSRVRRARYLPFILLGIAVSAVTLNAMLTQSPTVRLGTYHLAYSVGLTNGVLIIGLYIVATCGSLLVSGNRTLQYFGIANLVAVIVLALLCAEGFTSRWCFYAALVSGAIALHLRRRAPSFAR